MADLVYNKSICEKATQLLARGKSIAGLAVGLGVCRKTIYDWSDKHPEFAKAMRDGRDAAQAHWENIGEDGICGDIKGFAATAWMFTMKNRFREDYKEDKESKTVSETIVEKLLDKLID